MFGRPFHVSVLAGLALGLTGCLGPQKAEYQSVQPLAVSEPSAEADRIWEAIAETLRQHRFPLDRVDRRAGVVTTMPVVSQHLLEFWRHDVDTRADLWESTLNPIRRWVEVSVGPGEDRSWQQLAVVVHKERLSSPDRQFNSTGAAYQYFGDSLPSTTGPARVTAEHDVWLDEGRDPAMEERLLRMILGLVRPAPAGGTPVSSAPWRGRIILALAGPHQVRHGVSAPSGP